MSEPPAPSKKVFVREATGLTKQVSALDALGMTLSGMGLLYVYNVVAFTPAFYPTANPLVSALIGFLFVLPISLMYALMAISLPRTGGDYVWVSRIFSPGVGFLVNFVITIISLSFIGTVTPQISQWSLSPMLYDLGKIYKSDSYLGAALYLQGQISSFWITVGFVLLAGLVVIANVKLAARVVRYYTFLSFAIGAIFVATILVTGNSAFVSNFNALSGSNYTGTISAGQSAGAYSGIPPVFSFPTLYAGALSLLGFLAFFYPAYFAGEVKQSRRTQIFAQVGGSIIYTVFYTIIIAAEYFGEGPSFVNSMATLWISGSSQFPYITIPMASGMSMFWTQNPVLVSLFNLSYGGTILAMDIAIFFTLTRNLFAWSFDRVAPTTFASINTRTQTPVYATVIMMAIALVYAYIGEFQFGILASLFSYGTAGIFIAFLIVSLAVIFYPYRRREVFESSDALSRKRIGRLPVLTLLGIISFIISIVTVYAIVLPSIGGPFVTVLSEGIIPTFVVGAILYGIAREARKRQGIDLSLVQREIPPE